MELKREENGLSSYFRGLPFKLQRSEKTYILPTKFGLSFAAMTLVIFFLAAGYSNNLIFILVFFMISVGLSSTHFTNNNVQQINLISCSYDKLFAETPGHVFIQIENTSQKRKSFQLGLKFLDSRSDAAEVLEMKPRETQQVVTQIKFLRRGIQKLPVITLESDFPFGFLKAWKVKDMKTEVLVYPSLKGHVQFPREASQDPTQNSFGIFRDHKIYQPGDSKNKIDWRASAKRQNLLVKNFEEPEGLKLSFRWEQTSHIQGIEDRISQLALWVHEAEKLHADYAVHLGAFTVEFNQGFQHWKKIMDYLATVEMKS